jgi:hypothetical protein
MTKIIRIEEHFQHFLTAMKTVSGGICTARRRMAEFFELESERQGDRFSAGQPTSAGEGSGGTTATATMSEIS